MTLDGKNTIGFRIHTGRLHTNMALDMMAVVACLNCMEGWLR